MGIQRPKQPSYTANHEPWDAATIHYYATTLGVDKNNICCICLKVVEVQILKGSGVCSELCRKDRDNDHEPFIPVNLKVHEGEDK